MRAGWRGLTTRGRGLLTVGVALALASVALGQRDFLRVAVLLVALPLVAGVTVARRHDRLSVVRALEPPRVEVGESATVHLRLQNVGDRRSGAMLVSDHVDAALGEGPRLVVDRIEPGQRVEATYGLHATARGRRQIGPLTLRLEDPFGLVRMTRTTSTVHLLTVTPVVAPLPRSPVTAAGGGVADGLSRRTAAAGADDVGTRSYRPGDELRRVHWRATARTGSLMVRQEDEPWEAQALVLLDTRAVAHRARATVGPADLDSSSLEWAVHAAASIGTHLARTDRRVRVVAGRSEVTATGGWTGSMLDALAVVGADRAGELVPEAARHAVAPVVVAVLGSLDANDVASITALRHVATRGVAIVLDTASWAGGTSTPDGGEQLAAPLLAAGWSAVVARRGDDLGELWAQVTR